MILFFRQSSVDSDKVIALLLCGACVGTTIS